MIRTRTFAFMLLAVLATEPACAAARWSTPPEPAQRTRLRELLDRPDTRLLTRFGPVDYFTAVASDSGIACRLRADQRFGGGSDAEFGWRDLEGVQTWTEPEFTRGWRIGSIAGYVGGVITVIAIARPRGDYFDFLYPVVWAVGALPFGVLGGVVGGTITRLEDGWHTRVRIAHDTQEKEPSR